MIIDGWSGPVHPAADLFPLMQGDEFEALVESIKTQGLREPAWLTKDGALLDGRNRVRACQAAGIKPEFRQFNGEDPVAFVMALNMDRRHLTVGQRAALALKLVPMYEREAAKRIPQAAQQPRGVKSAVADLPRQKSRDMAGAAAKVSGRAVAQAKRIAEKAPDLLAKVESGELALDRAEREVKTREAREREQRRQTEAEQVALSGTTFDIRRGDFQTVLADLPDNSVDLVVTDPPYGDNYTHLYGDLAKWAADKLKPGGSLVAYVGQGNLPDVLEQMGTHLRYWWTLALMHKHGGQQLPGKWVMVEWKPLVWFVKGSRSGRLYVADRMSGSKPRKELHEWAQGVDEVAYLIEKLSEPNELVVDPFAGSGSFGHAAQTLGRHFIGAENGSHRDAT
jgi:16S rRNA G966 N2-methylase RsmD